jgi:hypothetical protein
VSASGAKWLRYADSQVVGEERLGGYVTGFPDVWARNGRATEAGRRGARKGVVVVTEIIL